MAQTMILDPQHIVRVYDYETLKVLETEGREDHDSHDYLQIEANYATATFMIELKALNDAEDDVDLKLTPKGAGEIILNGTLDALTIGGAIQQTLTGEGWSLNLLNITSTATVGEGTRGLRVNMTTSPAIVSGDMQCLHGYMTLGAGASLAAGAAIGPLSGWLEIPDTTTTSTGNVLAAVRAIFDAGNNDLSVLAGGGESALFYGQTWAGTGAIDHGLRVIAGTGTTMTNGISIGGAGTVGTLFEVGEAQPAATLCRIFHWGATDAAHGRLLNWYMGREVTRAGVFAAVPVVEGLGSLYFSSGGEIYIRVGNAGAATDWEVLSHAAADTG